MAIDVDTLVLLELTAGAVLTLMLLLVGRLLHGQAGLWPWVLALASVTLGRLVEMLLGGVPGASFLGAWLLCLGPALAWAGARDHCGRTRSNLPIAACVVAVGIAAHLGVAWSVPVVAAGWSVAAVWTLVRHAPDRQRAGTLLLAALVATHGLFQLARPFFSRTADAGPLLGTPLALESLGSIFFTVAWSFAVMGLTSQRLVSNLRDAARTDGLTGVLNRRAFLEDGARALEFCRRRARPCAVIMADIDHFKRLNDTEGHAAGDAALRLFASTASRTTGQAMVLGRYGGEEFSLVIPGADASLARDWAEQLRAEIAASARFTVSFGLAVGNGTELDLPGMVARADEALYRAKATGRDRICE